MKNCAYEIIKILKFPYLGICLNKIFLNDLDCNSRGCPSFIISLLLDITKQDSCRK